MMFWLKRRKVKEDWISRAVRLALESYDREMAGGGQVVEPPRKAEPAPKPFRASIESMQSIP